jgi:elongator complex protein 3
LRILGITLVEIGVQSVFDDILEKNKTGINAEKIKKATKLLKDAGFKVLYHLMPNLLGSNLERDFECFKTVFSNENFKPDWIKIYPLAVVKGTQIYRFWKKGKYKPYSDKELIELLIRIKKITPRWIRITRILRDIPATKIVAGCKISNLREIVKKEMEKRSLKCNCIRCREIREKYNLKEKIYLFREDYKASGGREIFLSFENKKRTKLYSFLRLRIPSQIFSFEKHFLPILNDSAIIREIQTFGQLVPIAKRKLAPQHRGLGKKLIKEAEKIAKKEFNLGKIAVISGVGAREYWRKLGFRLKETYMIKRL